MKPILLSLLFLICNQTFSQTPDIKYTDKIYIDHGVSTFFKNPLTSLTLKREVFDDKYNFSIPVLISFWVPMDNNISKNNIKVLQLGLFFKVKENLSLGTYFLNRQAFDVKPKKLSNGVYEKHDPYYAGYVNPLNIQVQLTNVHFPKSQINFEGSYYGYYKTGAFKVTYSYNLYTIPHLKSK